MNVLVEDMKNELDPDSQTLNSGRGPIIALIEGGGKTIGTSFVTNVIRDTFPDKLTTTIDANRNP